jgi:hypothetical protein
MEVEDLESKYARWDIESKEIVVLTAKVKEQ